MKNLIYKEKKAAENEIAKWEVLVNTVVEVGENNEKINKDFIHKLLGMYAGD